MRSTLDWLAAAAFALFGAVFLVAALRIGPSFGGGTGHRTLPIAVSAAILLLSLIVLARELRSPPEGLDPIGAPDFFRRALPLAGLMFLNGLGFVWFGYLAATLVTAILVFRLFGNSWPRALVHGTVGALVFYVLFFPVMGLYEPGGRLFDLSF